MHKVIKSFKTLNRALALSLIISITITHELKAETPCWQPQKNNGIVKSVSKIFTIELMDGRELTIANLEFAPDINPTSVNKWLQGKQISFRSSGRVKDRHNRFIAQIFIQENAKELWLQAHWVKNGDAVVTALPTVKDCVSVLLTMEHKARLNKRGAWGKKRGLKVYQAKDISSLNKMLQGSFQIIEGRIFDIGHSRRNVFVNFSDNWHDDFTILIERRLLKKKHLKWPNFEWLKNKKIRVRGWLDHWNGPMIRIDTPEMLEVIEEESIESSKTN